MNIEQEKMIVEALPSLYPLKNFEEEAIHAVLNAIPHWIPAEPKRGKWIRDGHHIRCDQCGIYMCDTDREETESRLSFARVAGRKWRGG